MAFKSASQLEFDLCLLDIMLQFGFNKNHAKSGKVIVSLVQQLSNRGRHRLGCPSLSDATRSIIFLRIEAWMSLEMSDINL